MFLVENEQFFQDQLRKQKSKLILKREYTEWTKIVGIRPWYGYKPLLFLIKALII